MAECNEHLHESPLHDAVCKLEEGYGCKNALVRDVTHAFHLGTVETVVCARRHGFKLDDLVYVEASGAEIVVRVVTCNQGPVPGVSAAANNLAGKSLDSPANDD